ANLAGIAGRMILRNLAIVAGPYRQPVPFELMAHEFGEDREGSGTARYRDRHRGRARSESDSKPAGEPVGDLAVARARNDVDMSHQPSMPRALSPVTTAATSRAAPTA